MWQFASSQSNHKKIFGAPLFPINIIRQPVTTYKPGGEYAFVLSDSMLPGVTNSSLGLCDLGLNYTTVIRKIIKIKKEEEQCAL